MKLTASLLIDAETVHRREHFRECARNAIKLLNQDIGVLPRVERGLRRTAATGALFNPAHRSAASLLVPLTNHLVTLTRCFLKRKTVNGLIMALPSGSGLLPEGCGHLAHRRALNAEHLGQKLVSERQYASPTRS